MEIIIVVTSLNLSYLGYIIWKEHSHQKQIKELIFLVKSKEPAEFQGYKIADTKLSKPKPPTHEEIDIADLNQDDLPDSDEI